MDGIALPGQKVFDAARPMLGAFVENKETFASTISLMKEGRLIPLKGYYIPVPGDYVVGVVTEERFSGYTVDLNSPYEGSFSTREVREEFCEGDVISTKVLEVTEMHNAVLGEPRKFDGGRLVEISHVKIPRVIGRNASMVQMIKDGTKTELFVGKNGRILLRGGNIALAVKAIAKIDAEAHTSGLTDRMKEFLEANQNSQ